MAVWDGIVIGGPPIPPGAFEDFYEADFTKPNTSLFNTAGGYNTIDGEWKLGGYLKLIQSYATSPDADASNQRNGETHNYYDAHGSRPNPFELISRRNGHLILGGRETLPSEAAYSRVKGYYQKADGQFADLAWFEANYPGGLPADWQPKTNFDADPQFNSMPSSHVAPMISQMGRRSCSFGETACRIKLPTGAKGDPGFETDLRKITTVFSAVWELQAIIHRANLNGIFIGSDTHTPANQASEGRHPELDVLELFGYDRAVLYQTMHYYIDGYTKQRSNGSRYASQTSTSYPGTNVGDVTQWLELRIQRTPGKIIFAVNNVVTNILNTPASIRNPLPFYIPEAGRSFEPQLNADFTVQTDGIQTRSDGSAIYMQWSPIVNTAFNARFTRGLARSGLISNPGAAAPYSPEIEIEIDWFTMRYLAVDNPDQSPTVDYTVGETGLTAGNVPDFTGGTVDPTDGGGNAVSLPNVTGLTWTKYSDASGALAWTTAPASSGVTGYLIYRNGELIATLTSRGNNNYQEQDTLTAGTAYDWEIISIDNAGSQSSGIHLAGVGGVSGGTVTVDPVTVGGGDTGVEAGYRPDNSNGGILFRQGHLDGTVEYQLEQPVPGTWDFSSYGADAVAVGPTDQPVLILEVAPVATATPRLVTFTPA